APEVDERLALEQREARHALSVAVRDATATPPGVPEPERRTIGRRGELVDVEVGGGLEGLGIVGAEGEGQGERVPRLLEPLGPLGPGAPAGGAIVIGGGGGQI